MNVRLDDTLTLRCVVDGDPKPYGEWGVEQSLIEAMGLLGSQIAKTLGSTSLRYRSDTFALDRYLIDVDQRAFDI